jgi:hypothetical protein
LTAALGWTLTAAAQEPAVTLGPPTVSLGAPRALPSGSVAPCSYDLIARGKIDDKSPMPAGPQLPAAPAAAAAPLPPPTPLSPAPNTITGPITGGPITSGPIMSGPVMGGPIMSDGSLPGACTNCCADPNWAPLPGGTFACDSRPCGCVLYGSVEALFWWINSGHVPPLLTSSPVPVGTLGAPPAQVVVGNTDMAPTGRVGARVTIGGWFDPCQTWGVVGSAFFVGNRGTSTALANNGTNNLARPFFNVNPNDFGPRFEPLSNGMFASNTSNELWGGDINARVNLCQGCQWRVDGLAGFRYLRFDESLNMEETFGGSFVDPNTLVIHTITNGMLFDNFKTTNDFYGAQIGLMGEVRRGCWFLDVTAKVALGTTHQSVTVGGGQSAFDNGVPVTRPFGLLAQPSNIGYHTHDSFAVVPEINLNLGYQFTQHLKVFVGYDFLGWSNVLRAGDQVDTTLNVNSRAFPITPTGMNRPVVPFHESNFWAQGFNVGLQYNW